MHRLCGSFKSKTGFEKWQHKHTWREQKQIVGSLILLCLAGNTVAYKLVDKRWGLELVPVRAALWCVCTSIHSRPTTSIGLQQAYYQRWGLKEDSSMYQQIQQAYYQRWGLEEDDSTYQQIQQAYHQRWWASRGTAGPAASIGSRVLQHDPLTCTLSC